MNIYLIVFIIFGLSWVVITDVNPDLYLNKQLKKILQWPKNVPLVKEFRIVYPWNLYLSNNGEDIVVLYLKNF